MIPLQIVGQKKSGKTTLMCWFIRQARKKDYRVTACKHTHHVVEIDIPETDTYRFAQAGATRVLMNSREGIFMHKRKMKAEADFFSESIDLYASDTTDILLFEGFKQKKAPKLVLLRPEDDITDFELTNVIAVGTIFPEKIGAGVIDLTRIDKAQGWFEKWYQKSLLEKEELLISNPHVFVKQSIRLSSESAKKQILERKFFERMCKSARMLGLQSATKLNGISPKYAGISSDDLQINFEISRLEIIVTCQSGRDDLKNNLAEISTLAACQGTILALYEHCVLLDKNIQLGRIEGFKQ